MSYANHFWLVAIIPVPLQAGQTPLPPHTAFRPSESTPLPLQPQQIPSPPHSVHVCCLDFELMLFESDMSLFSVLSLFNWELSFNWSLEDVFSASPPKQPDTDNESTTMPIIRIKTDFALQKHLHYFFEIIWVVELSFFNPYISTYSPTPRTIIKLQATSKKKVNTR